MLRDQVLLGAVGLDILALGLEGLVVVKGVQNALQRVPVASWDAADGQQDRGVRRRLRSSPHRSLSTGGSTQGQGGRWEGWGRGKGAGRSAFVIVQCGERPYAESGVPVHLMRRVGVETQERVELVFGPCFQGRAPVPVP